MWGWAQRHWRIVLGALATSASLSLQFGAKIVQLAGDVDFIASHAGWSDWLSDVSGALSNPPAYLVIALLIVGLALIYWDVRRHRSRGSRAVDMGDAGRDAPPSRPPIWPNPPLADQQALRKIIDLGACRGSIELNYKDGDYFRFTPISQCQVEITGAPPFGYVGEVSIEIINGGTQTIEWKNFEWVGGPAPTLLERGVETLVGRTTDAGRTWRFAVFGRSPDKEDDIHSPDGGKTWVSSSTGKVLWIYHKSGPGSSDS